MVQKMEVDEEQLSDQSTDKSNNESFSHVSDESSTNGDVVQPKIKDLQASRVEKKQTKVFTQCWQGIRKF